MKYRDRIDLSLIQPNVNWRRTRNELRRKESARISSLASAPQLENTGVPDQNAKRAPGLGIRTAKARVEYDKA
jgi:hypothetical protein